MHKNGIIYPWDDNYDNRCIAAHKDKEAALPHCHFISIMVDACCLSYCQSMHNCVWMLNQYTGYCSKFIILTNTERWKKILVKMDIIIIIIIIIIWLCNYIPRCNVGFENTGTDMLKLYHVYMKCGRSLTYYDREDLYFQAPQEWYALLRAIKTNVKLLFQYLK